MIEYLTDQAYKEYCEYISVGLNPVKTHKKREDITILRRGELTAIRRQNLLIFR